MHHNLRDMLNKDLEIDLLLNSNNIHIRCITEHYKKLVYSTEKKQFETAL